MVDLLFEFDDCLVISKGVEEILFAFVNENSIDKCPYICYYIGTDKRKEVK